MDPKKDSVKSANPTPSLDSFLMLKAMSPSTLVSCAKQNVAFFNCKKNKGEDPEACLEQAMDVRRCTLDTYVIFIFVMRVCVVRIFIIVFVR